MSPSSVDQSPIARYQSSIAIDHPSSPSIDRSIANHRSAIISQRRSSTIDHRHSASFVGHRTSMARPSSIDRSIDHRPPITNHRRSSSTDHQHPNGQPNLGSVGPMGPGSPRWVEQFATRIEQPLELATGPRVTSSMRVANIVPMRHVGAITSFPSVRRVRIQRASNKSHSRNI